MKFINAEYNGFSHKILIGNKIHNELILFLKKHEFKSKLCIVTDKNVAKYHLLSLLNYLKASKIKVEVLVLNQGEKAKSWFNLKKVVEWLISNQVERNDFIVSLGGGVIGDLTGFACSITRRGMKIIHMPTTLSSQVDSSIGGKTGINSSQGKNLVGTFHQPSLILSDISFLKTLKKREYLSGYAEAVKKALIKDYNFFKWLENKDYNELREDKNIIDIIYKSCEIKINLVQRDEKEQGERALLNLGHTFGHALETANHYSRNLLHGEAVIIGCCLALQLSRKFNLINSNQCERIINHFKRLNYYTEIKQTNINNFTAQKLLNIMYQDKKVVNKKLNFILLKRIGEGLIQKDVDADIVKKILTNSIKG